MQQSLGPGSLINRYRLTEEVGRGGMGIVYRAEDAQLQRSVAIKLLAPHLGQDATALARFQREAALIARLKHPHIATIYDFGQHDAYPYIAMEWVDGITLKQLFTQHNQLALDACLRLADQLANALDYAHQQGVIHRDLKPANIIVNAQGQATIVDFGLARLESAPAVTATGDILGTPRYMAPEQIQNMPVDGRADQYSLATILYEALAGTPVFQGETTPALLQQQLYIAPPAITEHNPTVPETVAVALEQALEKEPSKRFETVTSFSKSLHGLVPAPALTPAKSTASRPVWRWLLPLLAVVAAIAIGGLLIQQRAPTTATAPPTATALVDEEDLAETVDIPSAEPWWSDGWRMANGDPSQRSFVEGWLFPIDPDARWTAELDAPLAYPLLVSNGTVVTADTVGTLSVIDWFTGETSWQTRIGGTFSATPLIIFQEDELIIAATQEDGIYAFRRWDGSLKWRINAADLEDGTIISLTTIDDDRVLAASDLGVLYDIIAETGEIEAALELDEISQPPAVANAGIYIAGDRSIIYALDPASGEIVWETDLLAPINVGPLVFEETGQLYVSAGDAIYALSMLSGEITQDYPIETAVNSLSANWHHIYATTDAGEVGAISPYEEDLVWTTSLDAPIASQPMVLEEHVVVTTTNGVVHVLAPDDGTRDAALSTALDLDTNAAGRLIGGWLFINDDDTVYAFGARE